MEFRPILFGRFDVIGLRRFLPPAEQQDQPAARARKIDALAFADVNTQFIDAATDRFGSASIARFQPRETGGQALRGSLVAQPLEPFGERLFAIRLGVNFN